MKIFPSTTVVITTGGGGATTFNQYTMAFEKAGSSSYTTGGIEIDLSATYSSLNDVKMLIKKGTRGSVPYGRIEIALNSAAAGKFKYKIQKYQFVKSTAFGNITPGSQPTGVTIQATSGVDSSAGDSHTHSATHDHAAQASAAMSAAGAGVDTDALAPAINTHTHSVDLPSMGVTSGAEAAHIHRDNTIYQHQHTLTYASNNVSVTELTATTNISTTIFIILASGVRA